MMTLPLLPTTVVGSHGKAGWWFEGVKALEEGRWGAYDVQEMLDDAADTAIRDMTLAGIDVITDGEVRRLDGYVDSYYAVIKNIEPIEQAAQGGTLGLRSADPLPRGRQDRRAGRRARHRRRVRVPQGAHRQAGQGDLRWPAHLRLTDPPRRRVRSPYEVAERFASVINDELKALVAAGADWIQIDEPARGHGSGELMAKMFNLATEGVKAKLGFHICFGNRFGRARFKRHYADYFPGALAADAISSCWSSPAARCPRSSAGRTGTTAASSAAA